MTFRQPSALKPNDKVAIVSPSSAMPFLFSWVYEQGLDRLKQVFQLELIEFPTARQSPEYLKLLIGLGLKYHLVDIAT